MPINSRAKGKRGELELSAFLDSLGHPARRGQQFKGSGDSPDVVCPSLPGIHLEAKRVQAGNPYNWLLQAIGDAGAKIPVVAHKRNRKEWLAILRLEDLIRIIDRK